MKQIYILALVVGVALLGTQNISAMAEKTSKNVDVASLAKDPKFVKAMIDYMKKNHSFTQDVINAMLKDPSLRTQVIGHMTENKDAMKMVNQIMSGNNTMKGMKMDHAPMKKH